ncbi:putative ABC transporter ATP-binding/permease protein [Thermoflexales bacterium]|nr:putative ABC transporter ATP-binding/permease protein [Thermoflexales bacterium]
MSTLARLLKLIAPFKWWVTLAVWLNFLAIGASVGLMALSAYLISKAALMVNVSELALAITSVRLFATLRAILRYLERYFSHTATFRILTHLRVWFYRAIEPLAPARLMQYRSGDLLTRSVADIETLENFYIRVIVPPIAAALVVVLACLILGAFDGSLALALSVFLSLTGVALPLTMRWLGKRPAGQLIAARAELNAMLVDEIQGLADLLAFDQADAHRAKVLRLSDELQRVQEQQALLRGVSNALTVLFTSLAALTVLWLAIPLVSGGQIEGVYLAVLPLTAIASFEAVQPLALALQQLEASQAAGRRLFELIDAAPEVCDPTESASLRGAHAAPRATRPAAKTWRERNGVESKRVTKQSHSRLEEIASSSYGLLAKTDTDLTLAFKDVHFRYHPNDPLALDGVSFTIPAGSRAAIVGASGSGKSTIVNLLLRFWDYHEGQITLGGRDLHDYRADDVRALLGVVPQNVHLFNATLRDNLRLANPDATDEQIKAACHQAQLHEFIAGLPLGYDTPIGENGLLLSGGERQRLALARAILKNAPILILDEATANLDAITEEQLFRSLESFMADRTVLIISHHRVALEHVDQVIEVEQGRVISG